MEGLINHMRVIRAEHDLDRGAGRSVTSKSISETDARSPKIGEAR
jgi:hypothetical protein